MLYVHGMGHYHPENAITNQFIAELDIGSDEQWIMERVGIECRRTTLDLDYIRQTRNQDPRAASEAAGTPRGECGARAARLAIQRAGIGAQDIGMVVCGTSSPGYVCPAESSMVAAALGVEAPCFDLNSACSTFVVQMAVLSAMAGGRPPAYILVVNMENITHSVNYNDRNSAPLFGDGFCAAVVSHSEAAPIKLSAARYHSIPSSWDKATIAQGGHFRQDGRAVQGYAIRKTSESLKRLQDRFWPCPGAFRFVGHQANFMMLAHVCERCGVDQGNHWHNVTCFGNTGCAGAPSVLSQNWDNLGPGDHVALVVVGAGLTYGRAMVIAEPN